MVHGNIIQPNPAVACRRNMNSAFSIISADPCFTLAFANVPNGISCEIGQGYQCEGCQSNINAVLLVICPSRRCRVQRVSGSVEYFIQVPQVSGTLSRKVLSCAICIFYFFKSTRLLCDFFGPGISNVV